MKRNDIRSLHQKNVSELEAMVMVLRKELVTLRLQGSRGKEKNVHLRRRKRADLARFLSVLSLVRSKESTV